MIEELIRQPLAIVALCFPLLIAILTYFKSGLDKWWLPALIIGAIGFWRLIVLADQFINKDMELADQALTASGGQAEARSDFFSNVLGSYGLAAGLCITGLFFFIMKIIRGFGRLSAE